MRHHPAASLFFAVVVTFHVQAVISFSTKPLHHNHQIKSSQNSKVRYNSFALSSSYLDSLSPPSPSPQDDFSNAKKKAEANARALLSARLQMHLKAREKRAKEEAEVAAMESKKKAEATARALMGARFQMDLKAREERAKEEAEAAVVEALKKVEEDFEEEVVEEEEEEEEEDEAAEVVVEEEEEVAEEEEEVVAEVKEERIKEQAEDAEEKASEILAEEEARKASLTEENNEVKEKAIPNTSAIVPINEATIEFTAGLIGAAAGFVLGGGPVLAAITAAAANYASKSEGEAGEVVYGTSRSAIESYNYLVRFEDRYEVLKKGKETLQSALETALKSNDKVDPKLISDLEESIKMTSDRMCDIVEEYDLVNTSKLFLETIGDIVEKGVKKASEISEEYQLFDKIWGAVKSGVDKAKLSVKKE